MPGAVREPARVPLPQAALRRESAADGRGADALRPRGDGRLRRRRNGRP